MKSKTPVQVKEHYDNHLSHFYSWMLGDLESKSDTFKKLLLEYNVLPASTKVAIDLGAGNGIQSFALKDLGFHVTAVDFNDQLLNELRSNPRSGGINVVQRDIRQVSAFSALQPELIICCGDTITHLDNKEQVSKLIQDSSSILTPNGRLILTFRDNSTALTDKQRFIPVKNSPDRILTCILEYTPDKVRVTDLLHEKDANGNWIQKVSTYEKVRISSQEIEAYVEKSGMDVILNESLNGMQTIIARK